MPEVPVSIPQTLQDLPAQWAHFCLHIEKFITEDLDVDLTGKTVITAFSGGVDSTALLLVLHYLSKKSGSTIIAAHLNHQLRHDADAEALWTHDVCNALGIQHITHSVDIRKLAEQNDIGIEEAGRDARYALFNDIMKELNGDFIAVGHHLDDLCEDVLMRLIRGTAWPGLAGMVGFDESRKLIRPFLLTPKSKLIEFLTDIQMLWCEDTTNADPEWTRNRVRSSILPLFLEENPNFPESIARLWKVGKIDRNYWDNRTSHVNDFIPNEVLHVAHQAERLRLFKSSLDALGSGQVLADTLFKLDKAWNEKRIGTTFQFPGEKTATITASGVDFIPKH